MNPPSTAAPPRRHWLLWIYLLLLLASQIARRVHPFDGRMRADEVAVTVRAVDGSRERDRPVRLAYREFRPAASNEAPATILLVHGSPGDNSEVTALAKRLGVRFHTLAPDLPGFGGSSWKVPDYSNEAHARYLLQLLDSLHIASAHLVGFSMGGGVVLQMQRLAPGRVRSLTLLSAIGAQEYELLGDYHLNHGIHGLQLAGLWLLREATPNFGWLDDAVMSVPYARNFYDTDQRPLRGILERYDGPLLILHGERDVLVTAALAREHARIAPQAELRIDDGDHFSAFTHPDRVAAPIADFVDRVDRGVAVTRAAADPARVAASVLPFDPRTLPRIEGFALVIILVIIAAATLVSEDLTCIATGLMVARGAIGFLPGTLACFIGIFGGDLLVFLVGRTFGRALLRRAPFRWIISTDAVLASSLWLERQGAAIVFATRILPGTRLPTYFAAGMLRTSLARFAGYFFLACLLWTPLLVGISAAFGEVVQHALHLFERHAALYLLTLGLFLYLLLKLVIPLLTHRGRRMVRSRWHRLTRWEFWPRWAFYPPVVLYILWLALKHRSLLLFTAVNPGIPGGGFVGESKSDILTGLRASADLVARWELISRDLAPAARVTRAAAFRERLGLGWPIVLKPDIGERGSGVAICRSDAEVQAYLEITQGDTIIQEFAPGAEFGIFWLRYPGEPAGRIFAITEKRFPQVTGDGRRPLEALILDDDRAVSMAPFFLRRHSARLGWIPEAGEVVPLVELGTHCRGAAFFDGAWLETPALGAVIDRMSRGFEGFWFGRYDLRAPDIEALKAGRGFKVVELNGATSEATSIYDPKHSLAQAYLTLRAQWAACFEIASRNVAAGARPATLPELWQLMRRHRAATRHRD